MSVDFYKNCYFITWPSKAGECRIHTLSCKNAYETFAKIKTEHSGAKLFRVLEGIMTEVSA